MLTNDEALKIKKMVDKLEDMYYALGQETAFCSNHTEVSLASQAFVDYVESLIDPNEVLDHESQYH
jgi:hypothetical protein